MFVVTCIVKLCKVNSNGVGKLGDSILVNVKDDLNEKDIAYEPNKHFEDEANVEGENADDDVQYNHIYLNQNDEEEVEEDLIDDRDASEIYKFEEEILMSKEVQRQFLMNQIYGKTREMMTR